MMFYRWEDYSTYLGSYHDSRNDFSKKDTVRFTVGVEVPVAHLKGRRAFLLLQKKSCWERKYKKFRNPPVFYSGTNCDSPAELTIKDLANYYVLKSVKR